MQYTTEQLEQFLELAQDFATKAHEGQVDRGGNPYIEHPKRVAEFCEDIECKIVAWLHDVLEDTKMTVLDLREAGFPEEVVEAVVALTKTKGEEYSYEQYLERVKKNELARIVKLADMRHNMDLSRIPNVSVRDMKRTEKYRKGKRYLEAKE